MSRLDRVLHFTALTCAALVFGLTLSHVLQSPGSLRLACPEWLTVQHTFYGGFAVVGGAAEIIGLISAAILVFRSLRRKVKPPQTTTAGIAPLSTAFISALCFAGTLAAFWFGNRPVNAKVAVWTSTNLPPDWSSYRDSWETAHAISAGLGAVAFVALALTLVWRPSR